MHKTQQVVLERFAAMRKSVATLIALTSILASCGQSGSTAPTQPILNDKRMETVLLRLEPIGDISDGTFNEYIRGTATGFASIFLEEALKKEAAKDNYRAVDFVYLLNPVTAVSRNGKIFFSNPANFDRNFNTIVNLGWPSYSDGPQFVGLLRSKRFDPVTGAYFGLTEEDFDNVILPDQIKDIVDHSLRNGSEKRSTYTAGYSGFKMEQVELLGVYDSKGFVCLIKILPGVDVFGLNITVKRGYATN
jgi:hypothetical protein